MIRVLVVDNHAMTRQSLSSLLSRVDDIDVVGEASNGENAIVLAKRLMPDVVIMDLAMPGIGGLTATAAIRKLGEVTRVVIYSFYGTREYVDNALAAGASGYVLKGRVLEELVSAIRAVCEGTIYLGKGLDRGRGSSSTASS